MAMAKRMGSQRRVPVMNTPAKSEYRGKGRTETQGVVKGRPRLGRGGKRA